MNKLIILTLFLTAAGCQSKKEAANQAAVEVDLMKLPPPKLDAQQAIPLPEPGQPSATTNRKIIRNASLRIRVEDFKSSGRAIEQAVRQAGGQIESSNETKTTNSIENALTIRVPGTHFDALLTRLLNESVFTDTNTTTAEDITRRYVDIEARIRSKKAVEETYVRLLAQTRSVDDVLKVEAQLGKIREEREVQEAELRQLKDEVALSTIRLTYYQETELALRPEEPVYVQIKHNLTDGFRLLGGLLVGLFYFLPLGLVGGGIWLALRWRKQRRSKMN